MRISVCVCVLLGLALPQLASGAKHKGDKGKQGGGKSAHTAGDGEGRGAGARAAGGRAGGGGGARHESSAHMGHLDNGGQKAHAQHGLNAHHGGEHGLHARAGKGLQGQRPGKLSANHAVNRRYVARNHWSGHWRSGLRWRDHHALYVGYHRAWHDHWWWRSHYNRVAFVGGGYWGGHWYWDGGYWFPAWGYAPAYGGYIYDGPIFAYANLPPDEVVVNVQEVLQDQGYYTGDVDGQLGTRTRDALASYQRDHQLEVTAAIDEPTVQSLGLASDEA
jgi:hypothetical protein